MRKQEESSTKHMPKFLLWVAVLVALVAAIALYLFYAPGRSTSIAAPRTSSALSIGVDIAA